MKVHGFSVKREHQNITIIANDCDGNQVELAFWAGDVIDLAGLLIEAESQWQREENQAEAEWEAALDQKIDAYYMGDRETKLEMEYSDRGHDFDPPSGD